NGKLQPTTIIIGNHDTRKTRTGVSFQCNITFPPINATGKKLSILEYKGVSADGKSLLFNCINREDYFDNPYKQDAVINFYYNLKNIDLFSEKFYSEKDYKIIIKYLSIVYPTNEVALPSVSYDFEKQRAFYRTLSIDQLKTYTESLDTKEEEFFNSFRGYLISVDSADNSFSLRNINLSQAKESLSKNVNYVKITNFENSIKISLQPVFEISNNLKNQYYLYSKATFELNKLEEATNNIKVSPIGEKISDIDESLKGSCLTKDIYSIFTPSFCNKYTATSRWLLAPYSALGLGFIIVAFPVGIWALVE
ncbi:MAG: hypothetical protein LBH40_04880, partial [Alphaproteobacteria bacterium]|nr:hypothetical protein [Alphaproteobacteria bacterium]